ncbi:Receptor-like protein kinase HERK 1 [Bienertia sinuspersici]
MLYLVALASFLENDFAAANNYLINCGSSQNTTVGNRVFAADHYSSKFLSTPQKILGSTSVNSTHNSSNLPIYQTARIFTETSKYSLPVSQKGRYFIRLYFFPFVHESYRMSRASFSVSAQEFALLSDYTPESSPKVKEYSVNVTSNNLVIAFNPSGNSFAYVNAIEIVSVPDSLILDDANLVNPAGGYSGLVKQAMETVARVNMGGPFISYDSDILWRTWVTDEDFLMKNSSAVGVNNTGAVRYAPGLATKYSAPVNVYGTAKEMKSSNDPTANFNLYFNVYLDFWTVSHDLDLSTVTNALATPTFVDAVTPLVTSNKLRVRIGPSTISNVYPTAILNGLEIMKLNNSMASLSENAAVQFPSEKSSKAKVGMIVGVVVGGVCLVVAFAAFLFICCRKRNKLTRQGHSKSWIPLSLAGGASHSTRNFNFNYRIPFAAVQEATNNFDENLAIGIGGFGKVYKGVLADGTKVAVKRGNPRSQQGLAEFRTEIEMLSQFRHRHLVSLIGYCDEKNEMIQRLEICIGSARGLHYLHTGYAKAVIHRDVKSANILLDENFMAKVADFGLSKTGPELDQTHVSTAVKGSFGYLDPEYFRRQQLTEKSDVYSFGVVLFEVLCARPVIDPTLPREKVNLAEWAMKWHKKGQLDQIIDSSLAGGVKPESLRKFGETAEKCLADFGVDRPTMGDVLWNLEYTLQLQEQNIILDDPEDNSTNLIGTLSPQVHNFSENEDSVTSVTQGTTTDEDHSGVSMSKVFSQIVQPEGR